MLGRATVRALAGAGVEVDALSLHFDEPLGPVTRVVAADARDVDAVAAAVEGVDAVVHLAAIRHRDHGTPEQVYSTNVLSTFTVLARAGAAGVRRAVIASSLNAFGVPLSHHDVMPAYFPLDERIPEAIDDWYSLSKRSDEMTLAMASSHWGLSGVAIRFPWISTGDELRRDSERQTLDPSEGVRLGWAWIDLADAADAVVRALAADYQGAHVVGVAAEDTIVPYRTEDLLNRFAPGVELRRALPGRSSAVDTSRARELFGFAPRITLGYDPIGLP